MNFRTLHLLLQCGRDFGHKRLRSRGLSDTECLLSSYVYYHPGCSQEEASRELRLDKTTAAKALLTLENKGFVSRKRDHRDGRRNILQVTESGAERLSEILHIHDEWLGSVLSCLSPEEQAQFDDFCRRLLSSAEEKMSQLHED